LTSDKLQRYCTRRHRCSQSINWICKSHGDWEFGCWCLNKNWLSQVCTSLNYLLQQNLWNYS